MELFSLVYDPVIASPFAVVVEGPYGQKNIHGLTEQARSHFSNSSAQIPERMISTGFSPYTKSAQEAISGAITGDVYLSIDEIRPHVSPEMVYAGRTVLGKSRTAKPVFSLLKYGSSPKSAVLDYIAEKFKSSAKQHCVINEAKSFNIGFSKTSNSPISKSNEPGKAITIDKINSFLGKSLSRRMGLEINKKSLNNFSPNQRINRRVKSLIGNEFFDASNASVHERINFSGIERIRKI